MRRVQKNSPPFNAKKAITHVNISHRESSLTLRELQKFFYAEFLIQSENKKNIAVPQRFSLPWSRICCTVSKKCSAKSGLSNPEMTGIVRKNREAIISLSSLETEPSLNIKSL